jgi:hypothetical protein
MVNYYPEVHYLAQSVGAVLLGNEWSREKIRMLIWVVAVRSNRRSCGGAI